MQRFGQVATRKCKRGGHVYAETALGKPQSLLCTNHPVQPRYRRLFQGISRPLSNFRFVNSSHPQTFMGHSILEPAEFMNILESAPGYKAGSGSPSSTVNVSQHEGLLDLR